MPEPLKTLVVGCGLVAREKHLPAIRSMPGLISVQAVCDTNLELAKGLAARFNVPRVFSSLQEALQQVRPEMAILCTPPQTHRALGVEILRGGAHLLLEKPMALSVPDCEALSTAANDGKRQICIAFSQSFTPVVCRAYDRVAAGEIGTICGMEIFLSTPADYMTTKPDHWVHKLPGGALSETGPHVIHMARRFLGPISRGTLTGRKHLPLAWVSADDLRLQLFCEKGIASVTLLYATSHWAARIDLFGKKGRLSIDLQTGVLTRSTRPDLSAAGVWKSALREEASRLAEMARTAVSYASGKRKGGHRVLLEQFARALQNGSPSPVPPEEGLEVTRILEELASQLKPAS